MPLNQSDPIDILVDNLMLQLFLLLMICTAAVISAAMAFVPGRVLEFVKHSRAWMWYLGTFLNISNKTLSGVNAGRWVRIQGVFGLIASLLALYARFRGS